MSALFNNRLIIHHNLMNRKETLCGLPLRHQRGTLQSAMYGVGYWSCEFERDIRRTAEVYHDRVCEECLAKKALYDLDETDL